MPDGNHMTDQTVKRSRPAQIVRWFRYLVPTVVLIYGIIVLATPSAGDKAARVPILGTLYLGLAAGSFALLRWLQLGLEAESASSRFDRIVRDLSAKAVESARTVAGYAAAAKNGDAFAGVLLQDGRIRFSGNEYTITPGVRAVVETSGQILQRFTVTRLALLGPFGLALPKSKDRREVFLTIEGDDFAFVVPVDPTTQMAARQFAARVNAVSKQAAIGGMTEGPPTTEPTVNGVEHALTELQRLLERGLITSAEFDAKRAEILSRL
jgi:hypothetical protein